MTAIFAWVCAAVAALATLGAAYFFDKSADEGIAAAKNEAAQANLQAADAVKSTVQLQGEVALAKQRANESELKLEELRARIKPRTLNMDAFLKTIAGRPSAPVEVLYVRDDPECSQLAFSVSELLRSAKWQVLRLSAIIKADTLELEKSPSDISVG
jgi:hypothetical protein